MWGSYSLSAVENRLNEPAREIPEPAGGIPWLSEGERPQLSLRELLAILRRRLKLIIVCTALITIAAAIVALLLPRSYRAEALVVVDARRQQITNVQEVLSALPLEQVALRSEIDVLKSNGLIEKVVREAELASRAEFNPALSDPSGLPWKFLFWLTKDEQKAWKQAGIGVAERLGFKKKKEPEVQAEADAVAAAARTYRKHLNVYTDGRSLTIWISVSAADPELAAGLANLHAEYYVADQRRARAQATTHANEWLGERLKGLKEDVRQAEAAVTRYRSENQLVAGGSGITVTAQALAELNSQLTAVRAERAQNEARLQQIQQSIQAKVPLSSVSDVLASVTVQRLLEQAATVRRTLADTGTRYANETHPTVISARAQLREIQTLIAEEIGKITASLQRSVETSLARERALEQALRASMARVAETNLAELRLRELEREAEAIRAVYSTFLTRAKETALGPLSENAESRIVSSATVPDSPDFPNYVLFVTAGFLVALAVGVGMALLVEMSSDHVRSPAQCPYLLSIQGLGLVPEIRQWRLGRRRRAADVVLDPAGMPRHAIRSVLEVLLAAPCCSKADNEAVTVAITSTVPCEGKTLLAVWLARVASLVGYRVLLIDADFRRPMVERLLGEGRRSRSFGSVIPSDNSALSETGSSHSSSVREDAATGMHVATCSSSNGTADSLALQTLEAVLRRGTGAYDLIIVDTAPLLAAPEVLAISRRVDGVVLAARWGYTPSKQVRCAIGMLRAVRANVLGAVVTRANMRRHARYGFGDAGEVYFRFWKYYVV
jgi:succinoglycan biosynthesis transport protein ExoP